MINSEPLPPVPYALAPELFNQLVSHAWPHHSAISYVVDLDSLQICGANRAACEFYGIPLLGCPFPAVSQLPTPTLLQRLTEHGYYCDHHQRQGRTWHPVEVFTHPVTACNRHFSLIIVHDRRHMHELEESLRVEQQQLQRVINLVPHLIFAKDRSGRFVLVNQAFADFHGVSVEAALGMSEWDFPRPHAEIARFLAHDQAVFETGQPQSIAEQPATDCRTGEVRIFQVTKIPFGYQGNMAVLGVATDITAYKKMEQTLLAERDFAQVTLHSIADAVITINAQHGVRYMNPVAEQLTGWSLAEAQELPLSHVLKVVDENEPHRDLLAHYLGLDRVTHLGNHTLLINRNGQKYAIKSSLAPIYDQQQHLLGRVLVFSDVTETQELTRLMVHQATHDALTGLINRREFERRLQQILRDTRVDFTEHALCYLDLDQFKVINDTSGHGAGDRLLEQVSVLLKNQIRQKDVLARLGGDEFGLLLEGCPLDRATQIANHLRHLIEEFRFIYNDCIFRIGVSIGVVPINAASGDLQHVLRMADAACYVAKDQGRNRVHVYQADDAELLRRHGEMQWISRLPKAIEEDRFHLYFQPIAPLKISLSKGAHYELLIRFKDAQNQTVPPGGFLPTAERYNLATRLDRWVIRTAFNWFRRNPQKLDTLYLCAINLSAHSLADEPLMQFILDNFQQNHIFPRKICFEITETAAMTNRNHAFHFIETLKALGCRFALDDFGSGFASFSYLKKLPVDFLKIDGEFVKGIAHDPIDREMVMAINRIGHAMNKKTIAEFVEDEATLNVLRDIGVDYAQGYFIARPAPLEKL